MPFILAVKRQRQVILCEFQASLVVAEGSRQAMEWDHESHKTTQLKTGVLQHPGTLRWTQEGQEFKAGLSYMVKCELAWATWDPLSNRQTKSIYSSHHIHRVSLSYKLWGCREFSPLSYALWYEQIKICLEWSNDFKHEKIQEKETIFSSWIKCRYLRHKFFQIGSFICFSLSYTPLFAYS